MCGLIYKHTDPNGKAYIGWTKYSMEQRFKTHIKESKNLKDNSEFHKTIRIYGPEYFVSEVLESNIPLDKALERERFWILKYNTYYDGYNMNIGGFGVVKHNDKTKELISENTSKSLRLKFDNIYQYDLEGNFIREFDALSDTIEFFGVSSSMSNIKKCIDNPHRKYKNSLWRNTYTETIDKYLTPKIKWFHNPMTKETQKININKPNWENDIKDGFIIGVLKVECPYCEKNGNFNVMRKKHFDNCKFKESCT